MKRLLAISALPVLAVTAWLGYGLVLENAVPRVEMREIAGLPIESGKSLPFYELMSPLPKLEGVRAVPKLEYKKGPPERYLERLSVAFQDGRSGKEKIIFHGRKTESFPWVIRFFPEGAAREALFLESAIRLSQGQPMDKLSAWQRFLAKPYLLSTAQRWLKEAAVVRVMRQADAPAFLIEYKHELSSQERATALFLRRNSVYRVDYLADQSFRLLAPEDHFRKSFLVDKRADAMEYIARNLTQVKLGNDAMRTVGFSEIAWPILLLAANLSVDPASLDGFFHFAGVSALLLRSKALDDSDTETVDTLRNNVLASEFYAKDIDASSPRTAQIGHLARLLTRNID